MKTIGIIGGLTWYSTVEYYKLLNELVNKRLGGAHAARQEDGCRNLALLAAARAWCGFSGTRC